MRFKVSVSVTPSILSHSVPLMTVYDPLPLLTAEKLPPPTSFCPENEKVKYGVARAGVALKANAAAAQARDNCLIRVFILSSIPFHLIASITFKQFICH